MTVSQGEGFSRRRQAEWDASFTDFSAANLQFEGNAFLFLAGGNPILVKDFTYTNTRNYWAAHKHTARKVVVGGVILRFGTVVVKPILPLLRAARWSAPTVGNGGRLAGTARPTIPPPHPPVPRRDITERKGQFWQKCGGGLAGDGKKLVEQFPAPCSCGRWSARQGRVMAKGLLSAQGEARDFRRYANACGEAGPLSGARVDVECYPVLAVESADVTLVRPRH